jgi:hypothetical protein
MGSNDLSGTLPASWAAMTKLETMWVAAGCWPAGHLECCRRQHWIIMQLGYKHQLSTDGPCLLTSTRSCPRSNFRVNGLTGSLPPQWGALVNLKGVWAEGNQLSGDLPASWSQMASMETLWAAGARPPAGLPTCWLSLDGLVRLVHVQLMTERLFGVQVAGGRSCQCPLLCRNLYNNSFQSAVPTTWSAWRNLETL